MPTAPVLLEQIIGRCLEKNPARRYGSVAALAQALGPLSPKEGHASIQRVVRLLGAPEPEAASDTLQAPAPSSRAKQAMLILSALTLAGAGSAAVLHSSASPSAPRPSLSPPTSSTPMAAPSTEASATAASSSSAEAEAALSVPPPSPGKAHVPIPRRNAPPKSAAPQPAASARNADGQTEDVDLRDPTLQNR
jgi:serine/threonine-protein kinase